MSVPEYIYLVDSTDGSVSQVYCFPCILHYLNTAENKWARCPICFDSVNEKQLKSVKWYDGPVHTHADVEELHAESSSSASSSTAVETPFETEPRAGSTMHMRLMQRPQITTLALPRSHTWPSDLLPPHQAPFHFLPDVFSYAKFMLATPAYLISDLTRDLDELAAERHILARMKDEMGISFIDGAEEKVRNQMAKAAALESPLLRSKVDKALRDQREIEERTAFRIRRRKEEEARQNQSSDIPEEFLAFKGGLSNPSLLPPPPAGPIPDRDANTKSNTNRNVPRARRNVNPPPPSTSTYYYYQASSGLPLFLHPLDIKILLSHFHIYASFPDTITVRVDAFAEGTVNEDLRKRCKYLAHMPEGADVVFIEADLEAVVGADGLKNFEGALKMRASRRKEKGRKDDRARVRAEGRERERRNVESLAEWGVPLLSTPPSFQSQEFLLEGDVGEEPTTPVPVVPVSGAWGARSFASAAHAAPVQGGQLRPVRTPRDEADEWDMDVAFHELEQRSGGGGGRRKRSNKLVVLGGGGGRRR